VALFASPAAGAAGYPFTRFPYLGLFAGFLWAGALAFFGRILRAQIPWALKTEWVWFFTFAPVAIFVLPRLARRMVKGPAEEAFPIESHPTALGASVPTTRERMK